MQRINHCLAVIMAGVASSGLLAAGAAAQGSSVNQNETSRRSSQPRQFAIPAGPLSAALNAWSRQSGRSIIFLPDALADKRTAGVRGRMTDEDALRTLLNGSGLSRIDQDDGAVAIVEALVGGGEGGNATPDILVKGARSWSLNTGIKRSQDDSQPFIVMTREEIERSGAPNLEAFLRDKLNVNTTPGTSEQKRGSAAFATRGLSNINLRGLGTRDTLILVDGRRQPGVNIGNGNLTQPSITGIPIASIERIEVLASSASGIYGSGASGGVINIVLKRDFSGGEISATYADTTDFAQGQGQIDVTYGMPLEGGRTRVSLSGSWLKANPLLNGDRFGLTRRGIERIQANDPSFFEGRFARVPVGSAVNYNTLEGDELTLKPEFGGQTLATTRGTLPIGFRGVNVDGVAPLLASTGTFNFQPPDSAVNRGLRSPLLFGSERISGTLSVRRTFNDWLTGYVGVTLSRSTSDDFRARGPAEIILDAEAPGNPFVNKLSVTLPGVGAEAKVGNSQRSSSFVGGIIAKLPGEWQAAIDLSYSRSRFRGDAEPSLVSAATLGELQTGTQNVLRDVVGDPLNLVYSDAPFYQAQTDGRSSVFAPSIRIAGPLPISFPGGKAQMTVNVEYSDSRIGEVFNLTTGEDRGTIFYNAPAGQKTFAAYGEIAIPLIGVASNIPLVRELELRFSARMERLRNTGSDPFGCELEGRLSVPSLSAFCPPPGATVISNVNQTTQFNPSYSLRWSPFKSLMLRGSFTTGYLPPRLTDLTKTPQPRISLFVGDPQRGGELIGTPGPEGLEIPGFFGGNPDVRPESSRTFSGGAIFTPGFLEGFRFSVDWTRLRKKDVYFDPSLLLVQIDQATRDAFNQFVLSNPERFPRGPASDGFAVGPITSIDLSLANLVGLSTDAFDFVMEYNAPLFGGIVNSVTRATYVSNLTVESFPGIAGEDYAGVVASGFANNAGANGALRWRGTTTLNWTKDALSLGWQGRYFDKYALNVAREPVAAQGGATVPSQFYHDVNVSYRFNFGATLRAGINNVFNTRPPVDTTVADLYYSPYADARLRNFYLTMTKSF